MRRREMLAGLTGGAAALATQAWPQDSLVASEVAQNYAGEMLIAGFDGSTDQSPSAQALAEQIRAGRVGAVVFVKDNIGGRDDVLGLTRLFTQDAPKNIFLAIDHEGGAVQRLTEVHGAFRLPSARKVARSYTPDEARILYRLAGTAVADMGFNFNLAPVVDRHFKENPAIGRFNRAFSVDPLTIIDYAQAFIDGFGDAGLRCALKHFPGQGTAQADSHLSSPDLDLWADDDLEPFRQLVAANPQVAVMGGFARLPGDDPAALSHKTLTDLLRGQLGFGGVILTDDLDMGATGSGAERASVSIRALRAGNDMLMVRNHTAPEGDLPESLARWIDSALASGALAVPELDASLRRIALLRNTLGRAA